MREFIAIVELERTENPGKQTKIVNLFREFFDKFVYGEFTFCCGRTCDAVHKAGASYLF